VCNVFLASVSDPSALAEAPVAGATLRLRSSANGALTFREVTERLDSARFVGGGVRVIPERWSAGIAVTYGLMEAITSVTRVAGGLFWARRDDVEAVGGFDESVLVGEDVAFARRQR
jgi:GT2 family glycosyltransferase